MKQKTKRGSGRVLWGFIYVATFVAVFIGSVVFKMKYDPTHGAFQAKWDETVGTIYTDLTYPVGRLAA